MSRRADDDRQVAHENQKAKTVRIGIISFAHMHASSYAKSLTRLPHAEVAAVADDNEDRGGEAARQFGARYFRDYHQLLEQDIDAVIVTSENCLHREIVEAAAAAGKHVLCEKPIATSVPEARQMIEACRKAGVILQIAFPVRFSPAVRQARESVTRGELGRILAIRGTNRGRNPGGWFVKPRLSGGGAVLDHTVHILDLMRWFTGSEVREVYAEVDTLFGDGEADDCGLLTIEFENGIIASHDPSWSRSASFPAWGDATLEIVGTAGVIRVDAGAQHLTLHSDREARTVHVPWVDSNDDGLIADFVHCVKENGRPSISGEDGLRAMEVALAAYESARTGAPVRLERG